MTALQASQFGSFFQAVHGHKPFPWQQRLAERVCGSNGDSGNWPKCIALPTAAGKTACIDIAVFALACQASLPSEKRTAPRRIFFVVDRRVVVDQAYDHAETLAKTLGNATDGALARVASGLRQIAGCQCRSECKCRPLDVYALRGGMYRESAWVRSPLQPTVITSTVDQVGSRLLFRGYGVSDASKPLHAALVGNDSLILLDEAHCARPFDQTMALVLKYRAWTDKPEDRLTLPFHFVTMTATPTEGTPERDIERLGIDDRNDPDLGKRIKAPKRARLVIAERAKGKKWREELVKVLVERARGLQDNGHRAIGIIVNRVATARDTAAKLRAEVGEGADVILLTGRMRPMDRDAVMKTLEPLLSKNSRTSNHRIKPIFVVATQTIEVGADLDFHALVTECASLDALRQRFGRLNRVAARDKAEAVIVVRADQTEPAKDDAGADPVYGNSLARTWQWLNQHAKDASTTVTASDTNPGAEPAGKRRGKHANARAATTAAKVIDFGVEAMEALTKSMTPDGLAALNAPAPDAAVLLPAHLDMWCQTSPRPVPDPDPSYFLHGPLRGEPEVQVVFRADLGGDVDQWTEIVSLCPPSSSEALSVRLRDFRRWLSTTTEELEERPGDGSDVEGEQTDTENEIDAKNSSPPTRSPEVTRRVLRWRGPDSRDTAVIDAPGAVTPNDTYVVPITNDDQRKAAALLGDFPTEPDGTPKLTDAGDEAFQKSRDKAILRIVPALFALKPVGEAESAESAAESSEDSAEPTDADCLIARLVQSVAACHDDTDDEAEIPEQQLREALNAIREIEKTRPDAERRAWLLNSIDAILKERRFNAVPHPVRNSGWILTGKRRLHQFDPTFIEPDDSWESSSDRPYPLDQHGRDVSALAKSNAELAGLAAHSSSLGLAGLLHDTGKADPRFQAWLHGGNARRAEMGGTLYAKSVVAFTSRRELNASRERAGYPLGARHELISVRLAECDAALPPDLHPDQRDLILHLIASHHGFCRPFAPVVVDAEPRPFTRRLNDRTLSFTPDGSLSGHGLERLDSGVAERFWTLTRRYGWWGLPYLEALLRLADWACGEPPEHTTTTPPTALPAGRDPVAAAKQEGAS